MPPGPFAGEKTARGSPEAGFEVRHRWEGKPQTIQDFLNSTSYPALAGVGKRMARIVPVLLSCSCDGADDDALAMHFLKALVCLENLTLETFSEDDARDVRKHHFQGELRTS